MNNAAERMLEKYDCITVQDYEQALKEIIQELALCGLYRAGFFAKAAFCGGTALRIFHKLPRFSEDLDFSLVNPDPDFMLSDYFDAVKNELYLYGFDMEIESKGNADHQAVQSAFMKTGTQKILMTFSPLEASTLKMRDTQKTRIKFEIDTNPPSGAGYEEKVLLDPVFYQVKLMNKESMMAEKIHALLCRKYTKGRDFYDYVWYRQNNITVNMEHLRNALIQTGKITEQNTFTESTVKELLTEKISRVDFTEMKRDVMPFVRNMREIDWWNRERFEELL